MENQIKVMLKTICPHCTKDIIVEVESSAPIIKSVLTEGDIVAAKESAVKQLKNLLNSGDFDDVMNKDLKDAIEWINEPDTIFGPKDVDTVVESVINSKE